MTMSGRRVNLKSCFVAVAVGAFAAIGLPAPAAEALPCGRILFFSHSERGGELASVRGDGTGRRSIRDVPHGGFLLSPDASQIAFDHYDEEINRIDVWVMNTDGTGYRNVTETPDRSERVYGWAPGSRRLVIEAANPAGAPTIYLLNIRTGNLRRVVDGYEPSVSPDGKHVAFDGPSPDLLDRTWDIFTIRLSDGRIRRVTADRHSDDVGARWSPTGDWLAFNRYPVGQMNENEGPYSDIWRVRPSGEGARNLTNVQNDYNGVSPPVWSPDGKWIAYSTEHDGGGAVHVMRSDGSGDRAVTSALFHSSRAPSWSPSGDRVAFERFGSQSADIWSYDLRDGSKHDLTRTAKRSESGAMWASCRV